MKKLLDALIVGGGPAGSTTALLLARAGWSVGLVERTPFPRPKVCGEFMSATNLPLLRELGLVSDFLDIAGPEVRTVGVFSGRHAVVAEMPRLGHEDGAWGHALGRDRLDAMLLQRAVSAGAILWQPAHVAEVRPDRGAHICTVIDRLRGETLEVRAAVVVAAHGSWDAGQLPTQPERRAPRASDLFGFKARFLRGRLPAGLMPLLAFPGGYGGMVHSDRQYISLSCCIRRDRLEAARQAMPGVPAGDAVLSHMKKSCEAVGDILGAAIIEDGGWRAAGPIRPGVRYTHRNGVFLAGNAAGEAHPVVAEGISMAMQSAWLLARRLAEQGPLQDGSNHSRAAVEYGADWRRAFVFRIRAASLIAHWAMRPAATAMTIPLLHAFPAVLTAGARTTGKVTPICSPSF